jgi:hypothetical protein
MNLLFAFYGAPYPMSKALGVAALTVGVEKSSRDGVYFAMWFILTAICAVGVSFYLRYLVALCKECRFTRIRYLVRLEPKAHEGLMSEVARGETISRRAA